MTKQLEKRFAQVGSQEHVKDPIVIAKYFFPMSPATWYITEYHPEQRIFFGYVTGMLEDEWGYSSLDEFEKTRVYGVKIERDLYFEEKRFSELGL